MPEKRRLPVLKSAPEPEEDSRHPPWQWVGFGTVMIFAAWLPLAYFAEAIKARLAPSVGGAVALAVVPLAAAAVAGGFLVGRFGKPAGPREAALAGLATGLVASALACGSAGLSWTPLVALAALVPFAWWGGSLGARGRPG
jgi:hypothetical protein